MNMEKYLNKNIEAFSRRYPEIKETIEESLLKEQPIFADIAEVEDRRILYAELYQKQYQLDSLYSDDWVADKWVRSVNNGEKGNKTYIVFGVGNGRFVKRLSQYKDPEYAATIIVYEPDMSILSKALNFFDFSDILDDFLLSFTSNLIFSISLNKSLFNTSEISLLNIGGRSFIIVLNADKQFKLLVPIKMMTKKIVKRLFRFVLLLKSVSQFVEKK